MKIIIMIIGLFMCSAQVLASPSYGGARSDGDIDQVRLQVAEASISKGETPLEETVSENEIKPLKALVDDVSILAGMGYMVNGAYELITGHNPLKSFIVGAGLISVSELLENEIIP